MSQAIERRSQATPITSRQVAWGLVMIGPIITWALHLNLMYALVQPICALGGDWVFHLVSVLLLGVTVSTGLFAWRVRQATDRAETQRESKSAQRFAGTFGAIVAALVSLAILAQWYPVFVIGPCR